MNLKEVIEKCLKYERKYLCNWFLLKEHKGKWVFQAFTNMACYANAKYVRGEWADARYFLDCASMGEGEEGLHRYLKTRGPGSNLVVRHPSIKEPNVAMYDLHKDGWLKILTHCVMRRAVNEYHHLRTYQTLRKARIRSDVAAMMCHIVQVVAGRASLRVKSGHTLLCPREVSEESFLKLCRGEWKETPLYKDERSLYTSSYVRGLSDGKSITYSLSKFGEKVAGGWGGDTYRYDEKSIIKFSRYIEKKLKEMK